MGRVGIRNQRNGISLLDTNKMSGRERVSKPFVLPCPSKGSTVTGHDRVVYRNSWGRVEVTRTVGDGV